MTKSIEDIVTALYETISGPAGESRDWEANEAFFMKGAIMGRTVRDEDGAARLQLMNLRGYREGATELFQTMGFWEVETRHECTRYGNIAHVKSYYDGFGDAARKNRIKRGMNSIQLFLTEEGWKIVSMIWDDEENKFPPQG